MIRTSVVASVGFAVVIVTAAVVAQQPANDRTPARGPAVGIELRHNTPNEQATADQLQRLLTKFDVTPFRAVEQQFGLKLELQP
jgi:hypothetical protein